jgi:hypothetical protein
MVPEVTYGDYMQTVVTLGLCGVMIIIGFVFFITQMTKKK